jgi:hypothetical protein
MAVVVQMSCKECEGAFSLVVPCLFCALNDKIKDVFVVFLKENRKFAMSQ